MSQTNQPASARTILRMQVREGREAEFETAWRTAADEISRVPGNLRQELSRDLDDPRAFLIVSDWVDRAAADGFGRSAARESLTAALRDLRDDASSSAFQVLATVPAVNGPAVKGLPVRIDLTTSIGPGEEEAFERAYQIVTKRLVGTPGLIREELLKEPGSDQYHIFAEWESESDFINWMDDPSHAEQSGPLTRWLSVDFARRLFEIRYRPPQNVPTPWTAEFTPVAGQATGPQQVAVIPSTATGQAKHPSPELVPVKIGSPADDVAPATPESAVVPQAIRSDGAPVSRSTGRVCEVLVVGAGPAGLTHAIELARRGIAVRIIDKRAAPAEQADKAIGIHCRTMEIWEDQGIVGQAIDAGSWLHGQTVFVNGKQTHQVDWAGLPELPYAHLGLPQYETERILTERLSSLGVAVERGVELVSFDHDDAGVRAELRDAAGRIESVTSGYLVGCDGASSVVRSGLGLRFDGGLSMFPQLFMLGDVGLDWDMPQGHLLRFVRIEQDGDFTGMLVCVPLKGHGRYRVATLAPQRLQKTIGSGVVPPGFWREYDPPALSDIQAVLDDLAPAGTTASNLRWSSIFRIKHGIVDRYRQGRVFVAGDAAHLHPPAGGQGMNTGIQDAWNLGWKLALAVRGLAAPGLLDSYESERRPAGKAVVDRAVSIAFTDEMDMEDEKAQFLLEMQMTMNYAGSPLVGERNNGAGFLGGPEPGHRAPDAPGLRRFGVSHGLRVFELTRGTRATLLLYADATARADDIIDLEKLATAVRQQTSGQLDAYLVASPDADLPDLVDLPVVRDGAGAFRAAYGVSGVAAYLIRPDGHVGYRTTPVAADDLQEHLRLTYAGV